MKPHLLCKMAACLILPLCVGCSNSQVIRGQSADGEFLMQQQAKMAKYQQAMHKQYAGQQPPIQQMRHRQQGGAYCPPGNGGAYCPPGAGGWKTGHKNTYHQNKRPRNYQTYKYVPPAAVYPQQNQPLGIVQYPYYTHKGPDDFFLK
ncbi:hypothetical protein [Gimesia algae]|uniref:Uncharacterized protein n=1 Tax=Gimesia algae TaxID=2527971 RepID=A0A517VJR9_9PLAN|nr:hypothetical protein [Gimesia algae]QDT93254.1 hypothetical protein Pan161_49310 [Gimesia algae]